MELQLAVVAQSVTGDCIEFSHKRSPCLPQFGNSYLPGWSILWSTRGDVLGRESALHSADDLSSEWPSGHLDSFIFICGVYAVRGVGPLISLINSKIPINHSQSLGEYWCISFLFCWSSGRSTWLSKLVLFSTLWGACISTNKGSLSLSASLSLASFALMHFRFLGYEAHNCKGKVSTRASLDPTCPGIIIRLWALSWQIFHPSDKWASPLFAEILYPSISIRPGSCYHFVT